MTRCPKCGSYAINDDPERVLCDKCWRDAEIERLTREVDAWRRTFPIMHVREGAVFACMKLPEDER